MDTGKIASQAGHAYLGVFLSCQNPAILAGYHNDFPNSPGTKVCLSCKNLDNLLRAEIEAIAAGIPVYKVIDSGCKNFFDGKPTVTALGLGPATKSQINHITRRFQLM